MKRWVLLSWLVLCSPVWALNWEALSPQEIQRLTATVAAKQGKLYQEQVKLGLQTYYQSKFPQSEKYWQQALLAGGKNGLVYYYLGMLRYNQSDYRAAQGYLQQAIKDTTYFGTHYQKLVPSAYAALGFANNRLDHLPEAVSALNKALQLGYQKDPLPYQILAYAAYQNKQLSQVIGYLQQAIAIAPTDADNYLNLAEAYAENQQKSQAKNAYQQFLKLTQRSGQDSVVIEAKAKLQALD